MREITFQDLTPESDALYDYLQAHYTNPSIAFILMVFTTMRLADMLQTQDYSPARTQLHRDIERAFQDYTVAQGKENEAVH
jgi:hypothetical protein